MISINNICRVWIRFPPEEMKYLINSYLLSIMQSAALSSAIRHAKPQFGGRWRVENLNTELPLPTPAACEMRKNKKIYKII